MTNYHTANYMNTKKMQKRKQSFLRGLACPHKMIMTNHHIKVRISPKLH